MRKTYIALLLTFGCFWGFTWKSAVMALLVTLMLKCAAVLILDAYKGEGSL